MERRSSTAFKAEHVIATAKHFPGHGDTNVDSHRGLPIIDHSKASLKKTELVPFREAVDAGIASIMIAHIALPQIDPGGNKAAESLPRRRRRTRCRDSQSNGDDPGDVFRKKFRPNYFARRWVLTV